jgi:hypothetical protein
MASAIPALKAIRIDLWTRLGKNSYSCPSEVQHEEGPYVG